MAGDYSSIGQLFEVPTERSGQSLRQILGFGADAAAERYGVGIDSPLTAGQTLSLNQPLDPAGNMYRDITSPFSRTTATAPAEKALAASKPITEQAYAERGRQLEAEKAPLNERYQGLIAELTRRETKETGATSTALAREYGKRGVPLSSGAYEQDLLGKTGDISQFYAGQQKEVGFEREDKLRDIGNLLANLPTERARELNLIDQKIGELKAQGANQQMQMALEMFRQEREDKWRQQEFDLKKQEFEFSKQGSQASLKDQFTSIGEGSTLYDLLNRSAVYTAPKTYKGTSGGGSSLEDLERIFD